MDDSDVREPRSALRPEPEGPTSSYLRRVRQGEIAALDLLAEHVTPWLIAVSANRLRLLRAPHAVEPRDLAHDAWASVLPRLAQLGSRDGRVAPVLMRYLTTTIRHAARDLLLKQIRRGVGAGGASLACEATAELPDPTRGVVTRAVLSETVQHVRDALATLEPIDREILLQRGIEQLSAKEVAVALQISVDAVKQRYARAKQRLQQRLEGSVLDELD